MTVCAYKHALLFEDKRIRRIVEEAWLNSINVRSNIELDEYVIMPNHLHGIIIIRHKFSNQAVGAYCNTPLQSPLQDAKPSLSIPNNVKFKSPSHTVGSIVRGFKASSAGQINIMRKTPGMRVWQRNYYDHVIRNERDLYKIRKYTRENPLKWEIDEENPVNI